MTTLIIAFAGLWLALPAAAQFEIDPDHFDNPGTTVVQPRPTQAKKSVRVRLQHKQVQRGSRTGVQRDKEPNDRDADIVECSGRSTPPAHGTSRVGQTRADTKPTKQSRVAASLSYEWVPQ
jgi:hypothetical protein